MMHLGIELGFSSGILFLFGFTVRSKFRSLRWYNGYIS